MPTLIAPPIFTEFADAEFSVNRPLNEDTVTKMIMNLSFLSKAAFIGSYRSMHLGLSRVAVPSTSQFVLAQDIIGKYIRCAAGLTANNNIGYEVNNLAHSHDGETGDNTPNHRRIAEEGDRHDRAIDGHRHTIASDLSATEAVNTAYLGTAYYLKVS